MSEKNNIFENDLLMRAILEGGQEEVPGHIWDAVSAGLDKAASGQKEKTITLWWRRAGVSVAAVAAAVASVLVLSRPESADIVPAAVQGDMIAVVEQPAQENIVIEEAVEMEAGRQLQKKAAGLMAYVPEASVMHTGPAAIEELSAREDAQTSAPEETPEIRKEEMSPAAQERASEKAAAKRVSDEVSTKEYFPAVWDDEDDRKSRIRTSVVVSGITGASSSQSKGASGILKAPALTLAPAETGIIEKKSTSRYGLPVSAGVGVKIDFTPKWSLGVGLNYTLLTRTFNGTYTHVSEAGAIDNLVTSDIRNSQHYIGIPVNAYYNIVSSKHVNFYAYAGGAVEKCVYDKYSVITNSIVHKEPAKGVQLSANIGFGAEFMLGEHLGLYLDPSLRYYFDCDQPKSIRTEQPLMLGFELGFRFRL